MICCWGRGDVLFPPYVTVHVLLNISSNPAACSDVLSLSPWLIFFCWVLFLLNHIITLMKSILDSLHVWCHEVDYLKIASFTKFCLASFCSIKLSFFFSSGLCLSLSCPWQPLWVSPPPHLCSVIHHQSQTLPQGTPSVWECGSYHVEADLD